MILEFQSPSTAIINYPVPRRAQHIGWLVTSMFVACIIAMAVIKVDQVVTAQAIVVSKDADAGGAAAGNLDRPLDRRA